MGNKTARRCLQTGSGSLIILGLLHLAATPHIPDLLRGSPPAVYERAWGPTLLNHVLTGVLLLPLGFTTWVASFASERREPWALRVLATNTIVVFALPLALMIFMRRPEYYTAPLFLIGVLLSCAIPVLMACATISLARKRSSDGQQGL